MIRTLIVSMALLLGAPLAAQAGPFKEVPVPLSMINHCVDQSSQNFSLKPIMIKTIIGVEGGKVGTVSRNTNGSYDLGVMQVNTLHLSDLQEKFGYTWKDLVFDPCKNIQAGAWILSQRYSEVPGKPWLAVGNYHSKTPGKRSTYLRKIARVYSDLATVIGTPNESSALARTTGWGQAPATSQLSGNLSLTDQGVPSLAALEQSIQNGASPSFTAPLTRSAPRVTSPKPQVVALNTKRRILRFIE